MKTFRLPRLRLTLIVSKDPYHWASWFYTSDYHNICAGISILGLDLGFEYVRKSLLILDKPKRRYGWCLLRNS